MSSIFKASTVVDVVEAVPTLFGFAVSESFIGIITNGPRKAFGFRLRLDMPHVEGAAEAGEMIAHHLNEHAGDGVVLLALSADQDAADALTAEVVARLAPTNLILAARADAANVWLYDRHGMPDYGAPVYDRPDRVSAAVVQAVAGGQQIWSSREALAALFESAPVLYEISQDVEAIEAADAAAGERLALAATAALESASAGIVNDDHARVLAIAAQVIPVRDALWSTITHASAESDAEVWRRVAIKTAGKAAAGPYALAAFGYWLAGDGARSLMAVEQALRADIHHSLAGLVEMVLTQGVDPAKWTGMPA
ncbi:DUF4192 family protein [Aeromicrobium yanjiei]|nr:DUF4192 family protein [Aeromicrobium yanjiei]